MKPEEIQIIVESLSKGIQQHDSDYSPLYVIFSILITSAVPLIKYVKKMFTRSIEKVVNVHNENFKKVIQQHSESMDQVISSMEMYTEEIVAIHQNHRELKEEVGNQTKRIDKIEEKLED